EPGANGTDMLVHDPWRPAPAIGCGYGAPPGPASRDQSDNRPDILTYTTEPRREPLTIRGECEALLHLDADQPAFDVNCTLSCISESSSTGLTAGHASLTAPPGEQPLRIRLRPCCITLHQGERLRLSIAGAAYPAFPVNPGTGVLPAEASRA